MDYYSANATFELGLKLLTKNRFLQKAGDGFGSEQGRPCVDKKMTVIDWLDCAFDDGLAS